MNMAMMTSKENPAKAGVKVNPATKAALEGADDDTKLEILNRRISSLEDDDPKIADLIIERNGLEKACRIKELKKQLADLQDGQDDGEDSGDSGDAGESD